MQLRTIHIVSSLERINFGIWNAAMFAFEYLEQTHKVESHVWVPGKPGSNPIHPPGLKISWLGMSPLNAATIDATLSKNQHRPSDTIVITHGCWLLPTRLGHHLRQKGFLWIYVPHGMLEPWSMAQSSLKKRIFFNLVEKRLAKRSTRIRAVSKQERDNLSSTFQRSIDLVENGVPIPPASVKTSSLKTFLFLGRLHHKKGILSLVKAWDYSMKDRTDCRLIIAGPDQGELTKIKPYLSDNAGYVGPVYGKEKQEILNESHYFVLPSLSEGFPVSVLEAMSYSVIPLISDGCNFPQVFDQKLGFRIEPDEVQIAHTLQAVASRPFDGDVSGRNRQFVKENFSEKAIGDQLFRFYNSLLQS
jgi:glycosyltransferase involved in cell wall biosynthesis